MSGVLDYCYVQLHSGIFYEPGVKDTDWSARMSCGASMACSARVLPALLQQGQPTLNWLDPTFAAERLVIGDAVHELGVLGDGMRVSMPMACSASSATPMDASVAGHPLSYGESALPTWCGSWGDLLRGAPLPSIT